MKKCLAVFTLLLLSGCASTDDAGRFVGAAVGGAIRGAISGGNGNESRDRVVVIQQEPRWEPRWCSYWRYGERRFYRC